MTSTGFFGALRSQGKFSLTEDPLNRSPGKRLVDSILANNAKEVEALLQHGVDPNVTLGLVMSRGGGATYHNSEDSITSSAPQEQTRIKTWGALDDYSATMDKIFLWKKCFGDSPTTLHVAVLNVYHQNQYRRSLERALHILELLLRYGGNVSHSSHNVFLRPDRVIETNPIDLATGIQRMAMMLTLEKAESAILRAADIMRSYVDESKVIEGERHKVPFELVSLVSLEKTLDFLYVSESRRAAQSETIVNVITSDASRVLVNKSQVNENGNI